MCGQITVTDLEPRWLAEPPHSLKTLESVTFNSPAAVFTEQVRQNVSDGIHIGRDVQAPPQEVVSSIDNKG